MNNIQDNQSYLNNLMSQFSADLDAYVASKPRVNEVTSEQLDPALSCYKCGIFPTQRIPIMVKRWFRKPERLYICRTCLGKKLGVNIVD